MESGKSGILFPENLAIFEVIGFLQELSLTFKH
jgi:hypothetical protein